MKFTLRSASGVAILAGLAGAMPAWAQEAPQTVQTAQVSGPQVTPAPAAPAAVDQTKPATPKPDADDASNRVVVTGSYIAGTSESAALPVEVYSSQELEKQGSPTALEFVKSLSISGPTSGEAYYFGGAGLTGSVSFNLRGLGADKTLTLLNGRRMSQNTSNIPSAAIARTEILKDGAAVTYGADATGGVVNFITRDHFTGLEAKAHYKYVDGSDGDYGLSLLGGIGEGDTNFLWSAEWEHRSRLSTLDRDFSHTPYGVNPAPYSTLTNLAGWVPRGALPPAPPRGPAAAGATSANLEWGTPLGLVSDFTKSSCEAVNGVYTNAYTCQYGYIPYYNLVEDNDIYRLHAQLNSRITDHMDIHVEGSFGEVSSPQVFGSPAQPTIRGPAASPGLTYQFYVPITNPYAAAFASDHGVTGASGFTPITYRTFAHGGNDVFGSGNGYGVPSKIDNQVWRVSAELKGDLGNIFQGVLGETGYSLAGTYNEFITQGDAADIMGYRLQEALNGFGGPNCSAADLDPTRYGTQNPGAAGKNGCMYWNPFSSNFSSEPMLGLSNPNYVAGSENPKDLERWLFDQRLAETRTNNLTVDLVFNGKTGLTLPGGDVGWALGSQWRQTEYRENIPSNYYNGNTPCQWPSTSGQQPLPTSDPNFSGCTPDKPGPFVFFDTNPPDQSDQQQLSEFVEFSVPVLDTLNFQLAARHEEFSHNLKATVYKVSGKWDVWGPISIRGSYGTNYQAPPAGLIPGNINNGVNSYTKTGGLWLGAATQTQASIVPETAKSQNIGVIWQSRGITSDSDFRLIVDYFDIQTENEIGLLASVNDIAAIVFPGANATTTLADCSSPLISRVRFNGGACVQGVTTAGDFSTIRTDYGNGPGQHVAGYDIQATYSFPLLSGTMTFDATATRTVLDKVGPKTLDGYALDQGSNQLGLLNFATIANASSEWRANANANYNIGKHNFRLVANYISGVTDQRGCITPSGYQPNTGSTLVPYGQTCWGVNGTDWLTFDFHYNFDLTDTLRLSASIDNLLDADPPHAREELGYDPRIGNPLGRTIDISIKKTF
ncbi:MAG: TonB-dependent receptor plug domain-containing protein [Alphaproteobacteria bacterium]|nr:TonB-dependent receptor plug domain-containing protein [Alphaproteobacteria bacterium]